MSMTQDGQIVTRRLTELLLAAMLLVLPTRLRWSRRSSRLLALAGIALVLGGVRVNATPDSAPGAVGKLARKRDVLVGLSLIGSQYLLSEETSTVQGVVAGIGGVLVLLGLLRAGVDDKSSETAGSP